MIDKVRRILFRATLFSIILAVIISSPGMTFGEEGLSNVKVAGIVLKWIPKEREKNYRRAEDLIRKAAVEGADIICTTESFLDGYCVRKPGLTKKEIESLAEPIPEGRYFQRIRKLADELDIYIVAALTERDSANIYSSANLIDPDGILVGTYRKVFLHGNENNWYTKGDSFPVFETEFGRIGMMICFDRQQSRSIEELTQHGADLVFCPSGGGYGQWNDSIVTQRSREGKVPIVFVHPIEFLVTGCKGEVLERYLHGEELDATGKDPEEGVVRVCDLEFPLKTR